MCIFSGQVKEVSKTRIFARADDAHSQFIVYEMHVTAQRRLAMILPVPVDHAKGEKALRFINLQDYPGFFNDLDSGFPRAVPASGGVTLGLDSRKGYLKVEKVGVFDATFVPTLADFKRLDPVYQLSGDVWKQLPQYKDYGFAVFKLRNGESKYHPMAFSFERANPAELFFPTVHVHDGAVHKEADFDHSLYCQPGEKPMDLNGWIESDGPASRFVKVSKTLGIVADDKHAYLKEVYGKHPNRDVLLRCG